LTATTATMPPKKQPAAPSPIETTIAAAAKRLGVHERTLKEWLGVGCPGERGKYDVDAITAWRSANRAPPKSQEGGGRSKWERRKSRAEALTKELHYEQQQQKLLLVDRAVQVMRQHVAEVKTQLEQLPDKIVAAVKLPTAEKKKLRAKVAGWVRAYCTSFESSLRALAKTAKQDDKRLRGAAAKE